MTGQLKRYLRNKVREKKNQLIIHYVKYWCLILVLLHFGEMLCYHLAGLQIILLTKSALAKVKLILHDSFQPYHCNGKKICLLIYSYLREACCLVAGTWVGKTDLDYRPSRLNSVPSDLLPLLDQRIFDNTKVYQSLDWSFHNVNFTLSQRICGKHCSFFLLV